MFPSLMPKGVEHAAGTNGLPSVEGMFPSLMPKGVEHEKLAKEEAKRKAECFLR